jgi:hypothetical protein
LTLRALHDVSSYELTFMQAERLRYLRQVYGDDRVRALDQEGPRGRVRVSVLTRPRLGGELAERTGTIEPAGVVHWDMR